MTIAQASAAPSSLRAIQLSKEGVAAIRAAMRAEDQYRKLIEHLVTVIGRLTVVQSHSQFTRFVTQVGVIGLSATGISIVSDFSYKPPAKLLIELGNGSGIQCEVISCAALHAGIHRISASYIAELNAGPAAKPVEAVVAKTITPESLRQELSAKEIQEIRELELRLNIA